MGYQEHCLSRYRNPAYTFGNKYPSLRLCEGPGPKYLLDKPIRGGFSFGLVGKTFGILLILIFFELRTNHFVNYTFITDIRI